MKRVVLGMTLLCIILILSACGEHEGNKPKPSFKPYEYVPPTTPPSTTQKIEEENITGTGASTGRVALNGHIDDKLAYVLYTDGKLELSGAPVNSILKENERIKKKASEIKEISFGPGVTGIGEYACKDLTGLQKVYLSDETAEIGKYAFSGCTELAEISFGGVQKIGEYAFDGCAKLTHLQLDHIEAIERYAFNRCSELGNVEFGPNLSSIGVNAFSGCNSFVNATFASSVPSGALKEVASLASVSIQGNADSIGEYAFSGCSNLGNIEMTDRLTSIGKGAFENCGKLAGIALPDGIKAIQENTFIGCSKLNDVALPDGLQEVKESAFKDCVSLQKIVIPKNVRQIDQYAFAGCGDLQEIILPYSLEMIGTRAFENCAKLTSVAFFAGIASSERWICANCKTTNLPDVKFCENCGRENTRQASAPVRNGNHSNLRIGNYAFSGCSGLKELQLEVESVESYAFYACNALTRIDVTATSIGSNAFQGCSGLTAVKVALKGELGNQAFAQCSSLTDLNISADKIGNQAFQGCSLLSNVSLNVREIGNYVFSDCGSIQEIVISADSVGNHAFEKCAGLKNVTISNPGVKLGNEIFYGCPIDRLVISATKIPDHCFTNTSIKSVKMETSVKEIGASSFENCETLADIIMPSSITAIGNAAFKNCRRLESILDEKNNSISIPRGVQKLGKRIFEGCEGLRTLDIRARVIGEESFAGMPSLEGFSVSTDVIIIQKRAFENCTNLRTVDLKEKNDGASIEVIEDEAFKGCTSLTKFRLPATLKELGKEIFKGCNKNTLTVIVFGGTKDEWKKVNVVKKYEDWTGLDRSDTMTEWCKYGKKYNRW